MKIKKERPKNRLQIKKEKLDQLLDENKNLREEINQLKQETDWLNQFIEETIENLGHYKQENKRIKELLKEQEQALKIQHYKYFAKYHRKKNDENRTNQI